MSQGALVHSEAWLHPAVWGHRMLQGKELEWVLQISEMRISTKPILERQRPTLYEKDQQSVTFAK